jgi:acyl-CoA thioesterase I
MPRNRLLTAVMALATLLAAGGAFAADPSCPRAAVQRLRLPATGVALFHDRPITIIALGSSSTEGAGASAPDKAYPARLADTLRAAWPDAEVTVLNKGVGGQMVDSVLKRIETDVLDEEPTLVIWQVGTNEELRAMDPDRFAADLDAGVRRILASGADLVLMDSQIAPRVPDERLAEYDGIIAREAERRHLPLFSRTGLMREWRADGAADGMIGTDGLHHTDRGYACVAESLGQAIVVAAAKGVPVASSGRK